MLKTIALPGALPGVLAAAVLAGPGAQAQEPILIGFATAQSGWMEAYDKQPVNAAKLAIADINAAGGLLGRPIEIVEADTKTDRAEGSRAGREVVDAGAGLVVVSCDYDMGSPAAFAAQQAGVIAISLCANDPKMGIQGVGTHAFSWSFAAQSGGYTLAEWAWGQGWRNAYSLLDTTIEFNKSTCAGFNARWKELAGEAGFIGEDTWRNDDPSIAAQITRIQALPTAPDVIMLCTYNPGGASAIKQIRAAGIDTPLLSSQAMDGDYWLQAVPDLSGFYYNAYMSIFGDEPLPERQALLDRYVATYGERPTTSNFITGYALIQGYARAVERAGTDDPDAVLAELDKFQGEDILGIPITLSPEMHIQLSWPVLMMKVEGGRHQALDYTVNEASPPTTLLFPN
jgi:branched-chain amino acid transport system substrate-binding protein